MSDGKEYVSNLIRKARDAQKIAESFSQEKADLLCEAVSYACTRQPFREKAAGLLVEESKMGNKTDKEQKLYNKIISVYHEMKGQASVGIIGRDEKRKLVIYGKPIGVVCAIIPVTNGETTPVIKILWALKTRNAIILSPHHRGRKTMDYIVAYIRSILKELDAPEDLVQYIDEEHSGRDTVRELMEQSDFVVATGGKALVNAAYSSGTPAIGVGAGNCTVYVDKTADISLLAQNLNLSQTFDNSSSCSSESNLMIHEEVYEDVLTACRQRGAFVLRADQEEKQKLIKTIWPEWPKNNRMSRQTPAQSAEKLALLAGFTAPPSTAYYLVEEGDAVKIMKQPSLPVTAGEKLCPVLAAFRVKDYETALELTERILSYQGNGHSCGIYTKNEKQITEMAARMKVARVLVNQPHSMGNGGAWFNGMPSTNTLGCGTWGGNSSSQNITWRDLLNTTTLSYIIEEKQPLKEEEVFSESIKNLSISY